MSMMLEMKEALEGKILRVDDKKQEDTGDCDFDWLEEVYLRAGMATY